MTDATQHKPVRALVERMRNAVVTGSTKELKTIAIEADALDAIVQREPDELLQRAIESNRKVLERLKQPIQFSQWPTGEAAVEALARVLFAKGWTPLSTPYLVGGWNQQDDKEREYWLMHAAAVLAALTARGVGDVS